MHGNITKLIAAAGFTWLAYLLAEYLEYLVLKLTGAVNSSTGEVNSGAMPQFLLTAFCFGAAVLFGSPLLNGCLRMAANTAVKKSCEIRDMTFFFCGARRYFKTLLFNLLVWLLLCSSSALLNVSGYLSWLLPDLFNAEISLRLEGVLTVFAGVLTAVIRVLLYFLFAHYPLFAYALDDSLPPVSAFTMIGFSLKNYWKALRLAFSFIGWFALCFFVVPALYVLPYFAVASAASVRWLRELNSNGGAK